MGGISHPFISYVHIADPSAIRGEGENKMMLKLKIANSNRNTKTPGRSTVRAKEYKLACDFFTELGISIIEKPQERVGKSLNLVVDGGTTLQLGNFIIIDPFLYRISQATLIEMYQSLKSGSNHAIQFIMALTDAVKETDINDYKKLKETKYPHQMFTNMIEILNQICEDHFVKIEESDDYMKQLKTISKKLGGYDGLFTILLNIIAFVADHADDRHHIPRARYNRCISCKFCKYDDYQNRYCKVCNRKVPTDMTVEEVNNLYAEVKMVGHGLVSKYIPLPITECKNYIHR